MSNGIAGVATSITFNGVEIVAHHNLPKVQKLKIKDDLLINDGVRLFINDWLLVMFGERSLSYRVGNKMYVSKDQFDAIRSVIK